MGSGTQSAQCTAGYVFADASATYGSTAGHCGQVGDAVAVGPTLIDTIAINPFQPSREVRANAALYSLSRGGWSHRPVLHEAEDHAVVVGHLTDAEITRGLELCFSGRTTTERSCGAVNAAHRVICCDANDKSSVFSCIDRLARAGDSGAPVFRPLDAGRVIAAGLLSSSVTIDGRSSMCFSTIDNIQSETGTTIVTAPGPPPQPAPAPQQPEPPAPATNQPAAPPDRPPPPTEQPASAAEPSGAMSEPSLPPAQNEGTTTLEKALGALLGQ